MNEQVKTRRLPPVTILLVSLAAILLFLFHGSHGIALITLGLTTILLIIFGERFAADEWLESRGIPGRDAIIPVIALAIALSLGAVSTDSLVHVFRNKIDIVCLILSFAIVSEGIARSGYFAFAAFKIVAKCQGNTTRLIIYLYILASVLAFFTSNDIVILVLTPVILSICAHARIINTRLLLMSQFVAANTMSMGTLIGSPTNIIFGNTLNMNFFSYLFMMLVPTFLCGALSLIVIDWINRQSRPGSNGLFVKRWSYDDTYRIPAAVRYARFTKPMKTWLIFFGLAVALLAVVSSLHRSLLFAAVPIALGSLHFLYRGKKEETGSKEEATKDIRNVLASLPYSIFFFGMTFFAFSYEISMLDVTQNTILPFVRDHLFNDVVRASFSMLIVTGGLVNTMNDLPASALLSDLLLHLNLHGGVLNEYLKLVVMQAILVGLNIGCYVTPIGALAGLMWFNIIRREERRMAVKEKPAAKDKQPRTAPAKILTPSRGDLVLYGLMHFALVTFVVGYLLPFFVHIVDMLVSSPAIANETALPNLLSIRQYLPYIGLALILFTVLSVRGVLLRSGVLLGHMREVFVVMTRVTIWTMKNRLLYLIALGSLLLAAASFLLYWSETTHERIFGIAEGSKPLFDSLSSFLIWAMVFSGAGLSDAYKPHSALGMALTSILPVLVIGGIVLIMQLSSEKTIQQLARRMASGDIPGYRIVVINFHSRFEKFVETMLYNRAATILMLCSPATYDRAMAFCARLDAKPATASRTYAALKHADASYSIEEYRIDHADEIYLLSDMTVLGEYDKIRYVTKLDSALNTIRNVMTDGMDLQETAEEKTAAADLDNLEGVPKIFIESCAERYHTLMQKASSTLFLRTTIQVTCDRDISDLLMSDMDESLASLNRYYKLGHSNSVPEFFKDGASPLAESILREFELDEEGRTLFCSHFSGPMIDDEDMAQMAAHIPTLQQTSSLARTMISEKTQGARYIDNGELKSLNTADLLGVTANVAGSRIHLSIPSAALSMQMVNVEKIVVKQRSDSSAGFPEPVIRRSDYRVFVFNLSQLARSFVRKLLPLFAGEKEPRVVLLCSGSQFVPEDIKSSPYVHILQSDHMEALVQEICPTLEERATMGNGPGFSPLLRKGDRLYGFLEHDSQNAEAGSIDFMDLLDTRLRELVHDASVKGVPAPISHPEVYIAMEAVGADSRFMMENFYIDKIIDTSMPKLNYLETLAMLFHRIASDKSVVGDMQGTVFNFRRAAEIASYLCHFTVVLAEDITLRDSGGTEITLLGKTMAEAADDIRSYSMPPMQLFGRLRVESVPHKASKYSGNTFGLREIPGNEPIRTGDLLLNIPII